MNLGGSCGCVVTDTLSGIVIVLCGEIVRPCPLALLKEKKRKRKTSSTESYEVSVNVVSERRNISSNVILFVCLFFLFLDSVRMLVFTYYVSFMIPNGPPRGPTLGASSYIRILAVKRDPLTRGNVKFIGQMPNLE